MIAVKATREGLQGKPMATGIKVSDDLPFVALPSVAALRQWVRVINARTGASCYALVLDVGPWNTADHKYVFQGARPQAETGFDMTKPTPRKTNHAGIDLGEYVWKALGMTDNDLVFWEFVSCP